MIRFTEEYEKIGVQAPVWQNCHGLVENATAAAPLGKMFVMNDIPV